ncbi:hypothetical protein ACFV8Z_44885 [Streptomyces sp. NPDC059837]|uniref:hypothetical protein n=1 Tax=unclassified Streptomyces TaxID=2593676 RepID=UPI00365C40A8
MDITALVSYLAPLLSQLLNIAAGEPGEPSPARRIWDRLRGRLAERPAASEAVRDVAQHPDDEVFRTVLFAQLRKLFDEDPALAAEIGRLFEEAHESGATGNVTNVNVSGSRSVGIGGNFTGGSITTGDQ